MSGKQLPQLLSCNTYKRRTNRITPACKQATQCPWTLVSSSKLRGRVRIALEINLLYMDIRQAATNLTSSQIMIQNQIVMHNHYAKMIRNPNTVRMMLVTAAVMWITTYSLTMTTRYTAMIQATNDNQRHWSVNFLRKYRQRLKNRRQYYASVPFTIT